MEKFYIRMGDGSVAELSESELKRDLEEGTRDAAERAKILPLSEDELSYLFDVYSSLAKLVGVDRGNEVIQNCIGCGNRIRRRGLLLHRVESLQIFEKLLGADILELGHTDYSFKLVKIPIAFERTEIEQALLLTTVPLLYGSMPNLGLYTQPDGPCPNPMELLPQGKIAEARASQKEMIEYAVKDMVYVGGRMCESGVAGLDFAGTAAAGDVGFLATLRAIEILRKKYPQVCIEVTMSCGEFVLGMHGELTYDGVRLAGLYPHKQLELAEKAGATIFCPGVNTNTRKSCPWNIARVATFTKACVRNSHIPIHGKIGMGVGGIPMVAQPPVDAVSRAAKAIVEITRLDGLRSGPGDPAGMASVHVTASGMGGMRTAGDLVGRMQVSRGMKIKEAKEYVANKLKVSVSDLADPVVMNEVREDLDIGMVSTVFFPGAAKGIEAKFRIAELLGVEINCVNMFKDRIGRKLRT